MTSGGGCPCYIGFPVKLSTVRGLSCLPFMHEAAMESVPYYEEPPSYDHFLQNHLLPNRPALIGPALTKDWRARKEWVEPTNANGAHTPAMQPRLDYLREQFGEAKVTVADCQERDFNDQKRVDMKFEEFVDMFSSGRYYLKDWHMVKAFPNYHAYKVPDIFAGKCCIIPLGIVYLH